MVGMETEPDTAHTQEAGLKRMNVVNALGCADTETGRMVQFDRLSHQKS